MAVYTPHAHSDETLAAARNWSERCLQADGSLFSEERLWTAENFASLKRAFNDNPLLGTDSFYVKLSQQLSEESPQVQKLAAECLWLLLLFVHSSGFSTALQRQRIGEIWSLSGEELPRSNLLSDGALDGIGWPGTAFLTRIWAEFGFLTLVMLAWKSLPNEERQRLLNPSDPWPFCEWLTSQPEGDKRIFRNTLLYLLFPGSFERISGRKQKTTIYAAFSKELRDKADFTQAPSSPCELDKALLKIRQILEAEHGTDQLDFYNDPLKAVWGFDTAPEPVPPVTSNQLPRRYWIEKTIVSGRPDRETGEHALGRALWSPQRASGGQDIYSPMRHVQPGDIILHLTDNRAFTGVSVAAGPADESFVGLSGTDWEDQPGYRIQLQDFQPIDPSLSRQSFLEKEPFRSQLAELQRGGVRGLFYNRNLELNQGAYLTEAPAGLIAILAAAYRAQAGSDLPHLDDIEDTSAEAADTSVGVEDLFLEPEEIAAVLALWRAKTNVILQGPPGVGKSFAAQRLAYALMGTRDPSRLGFVQFHQSYAYEDFVEGFRPTETGFELKKGKFVEFCRRAAADADRAYVFIIDEINRGNLSKILGELMLLIESDKRHSSWQMPLAYGNKPFHVPPNVYLLGLMNTADRSLAVVDYALRRRFAFVDLKPKLHSTKLSEILLERGVGLDTQAAIIQRVGALNSVIEGDLANLGPGFAIGHSFFCAGPAAGEGADAWYQRVISTEILPLLREYWFDAPQKVSEWEERLLAPL
jgi:MoxR-like ATPase